jgi:hypothetical protein
VYTQTHKELTSLLKELMVIIIQHINKNILFNHSTFFSWEIDFCIGNTNIHIYVKIYRAQNTMLNFMIQSQYIYVIFQTATILVMKVIVYLSFLSSKIAHIGRWGFLPSLQRLQVWNRSLSPSLSSDFWTVWLISWAPCLIPSWPLNKFLVPLSSPWYRLVSASCRLYSPTFVRPSSTLISPARFTLLLLSVPRYVLLLVYYCHRLELLRC